MEKILTHPTGIPVRRGDQLKVSSYSSVAGTVIGVMVRILSIGGYVTDPINRFFTSDATRTENAIFIDLTDGVLVSVDVFVSAGTAIVRGQNFIKASIFRSSSTTPTRVAQVMSNYVTSGLPITYPNSDLISSLDGMGILVTGLSGVQFGTNNATITVPVNTRWRISSCASNLTTDVTVANRNLKIDFTGTIGLRAHVETPITQPASIVARQYFIGGYSQSTALSLGLNVYIQLLFSIILNAADIIVQQIQNGVAGDSHAISSFAEEWLDV